MSDSKTAVAHREMRFDIPAADIYETADGVEMLVDMPGVEKDSLDITVERSTVTLSGTLHREALSGYELLYSEYGSDGFERSVTLSDEFDLSRVRAEFENGVLRISIPKAETAKPRKIEIR